MSSTAQRELLEASARRRIRAWLSQVIANALPTPVNETHAKQIAALNEQLLARATDAALHTMLELIDREAAAVDASGELDADEAVRALTAHLTGQLRQLTAPIH